MYALYNKSFLNDVPLVLIMPSLKKKNCLQVLSFQQQQKNQEQT